MGLSLAVGWLLATFAACPVAEQVSRSGGHLSRFEYEETHMASPFHIVLYSTDETSARRASRAAFDRIAALNSILSDYDPDSELSRLGRAAGGAPVRVSIDLFDVLLRSREIYDQSGGAFDVTIAPVGRLWRRARRDHKLPDPARLAEARPLVGSDKMVLDRTARHRSAHETTYETRRRRNRQRLRRAGGLGRAQEGRNHAGLGRRSGRHRGR